MYESKPAPSVRRMARVAKTTLVIGLLLTACGRPTGSAAPAPGRAPEPVAEARPEPQNALALRALRGNILADGSSTVYPITQAAAEEFRKYAPDVRTSVGISGTGGGFKKFCVGETDISDASRPISPTERQACADSGVEYIEIPVAYDALSVVVNPRNTWATCMTVAELKRIWEPDAQGTIVNWRQVRDSFPDRALKLYGPGTDSGTFDYFTEAINGKEKASRGDFQASEDDNVLVQGVSGDEAALGYFGYAYYVENQRKLKTVAIDKLSDGKCVQPSVESVKDGTYQPLSRPLFIYVKKDAAQRAEVKAFVEYYLSKSFTPVIQTREVGYVPLPNAVYQAAARRFGAGALGTLFPNGSEVGATLDRYTN